MESNSDSGSSSLFQSRKEFAKLEKNGRIYGETCVRTKKKKENGCDMFHIMFCMSMILSEVKSPCSRIRLENSRTDRIDWF